MPANILPLNNQRHLANLNTNIHIQSPQKTSVTSAPEKSIEQRVTERLESLGRPLDGWYFEKTLGPAASLNYEQLSGINDVLKLTDNVKNIVSFGAREGGFELAMQFRQDLYGDNKKPTASSTNTATHYLDAISLQSNQFTKLEKLKNIDVFKMQNPFWDIGYKNGIEHSKNMVFFITPEWLSSDFCKQEFQWLNEAKNKNINSAFVIFKDVDPTDSHIEKILDYATTNNSFILSAKTPPDSGINDIMIENSSNLSFKRLLTEHESREISNFLAKHD